MKHLPIRECVWAMGFLAVVLVLYVLSVGPVAYLQRCGRLPGDIWYWAAFYEPYGWLFRDTPMEGPLTAYEMWWVLLAS